MMDVVDHHNHQRIFRFRAIIIFIACLFMLCVLLGRLAYLQLSAHEHFEALSENNRVRLQAIPPPRGLIYDRHGHILAENYPSYRLEVVHARVDDMKAMLESLGKFFSFTDNELERFQRASRRESRFKSVPLKFNLSDEQVARFAVNKHRFPGVDVVGHLSRFYPHQSLAAHAIGYIGRINNAEQEKLDADPTDKANYSASTHIGKVGIEQAYEHMLHGKVGYQTVEVNAEGRIVHVLEETVPEPGQDIYLTIDKDIQMVAEDALGEEVGAVVMLDIDTGELLTFASMPSFNLQPFVNGISFKAYAELRDDIDIPLFNRVVRGRYPPGSILKPFIGLGALERKLIEAKRSVMCRGVYQLDNDRTQHKYRDWKKHGHGRVDMHASIVESCDVYFYDLSHKMGINRIHDILAGFGFGKKTGVDIAGEKSGLIPNRAWKKHTYGQPWYDGETLISGIGQGFMLTTPLQLVSATAALALNGKRYRPRLLRGHHDVSRNSPVFYPPEAMPSVLVADEKNWSLVKNAMRDVVHGKKGTAKYIRSREYGIAGKTGTAQVKSIAQDAEYDKENTAKKQRDHALFAGYMPYEKPEVAIIVLVENGGSGGSVAAPIARKVFDAYMKKRELINGTAEL